MREAAQRRNLAVQALAGLVAVGLMSLAAVLDGAWLERHILPEFFQPRDEQLRLLTGVRAALLALGVLLIWPVGPWLARRRLADMLPYVVAVALAVVTAEVLLRVLPWYSIHQLPAQREPQRRRDPVMGWTYRPDRVGRGELGGRMIEYAFDPAGHRVRRRGDVVDYSQPSVLFVGESIVGGHGVTYDETIPALVGARLGLQPANLSVGGFATDQMYLRFRQEWPRYREPRAVVILFMPLLFHRNLEHDRPHLEPGLVWRPASDDLRLVQIARRLVPARSQREIDDAVLMTRQALAAMVAAAEARGAVPLVLVPQLTEETAEEATIRRRVLTGLPYLHVPLDPAWRVANNRHPDARADAALADAVAEYLQAQLVHHPAPRPRPRH
ncbi:hypothetical protein [Phenylobacterium sp.]|uniref:hypothetical protein n=1 Tax=Phenylobacterium sp. TaxID=1871053 RepID=UPI002EDA8A0F